MGVVQLIGPFLYPRGKEINERNHMNETPVLSSQLVKSLADLPGAQLSNQKQMNNEPINK